MLWEKKALKIFTKCAIWFKKWIFKIESSAQALDLTRKLEAVINRMIDREGILIVSNDNAEDKMERILTLNVNYTAPSFS